MDRTGLMFEVEKAVLPQKEKVKNAQEGPKDGTPHWKKHGVITKAGSKWRAFMFPPALVSKNEIFFASGLMEKMLCNQQNFQPASHTEDSLGY